MIDAVLSWHMNPATCGVAKFNHRLARELGVPLLPLSQGFLLGYRHWRGLEWTPAYPLVSVKHAELPSDDHIMVPAAPFDLFLHDLHDSALIRGAERVYVANAEIADGLREVRQDVIVAWCPSLVEGRVDRGTYRLLTFGMAHKLALPHFRRLKTQLEREHPDYTISLSTAVHEGSPWHAAHAESVAAMRAIFGDRLRVLGFLADDALAKELAECDAVAAFFDPALRANNTSAWAALEAGKHLYTNRDAYSPPPDPVRYGWAALTELLDA